MYTAEKQGYNFNNIMKIMKKTKQKGRHGPGKTKTGASAPAFFEEVPSRFELENKGFADLRLTTWLWHRIKMER